MSQRYLFWATFVLLLGLSISQETTDVPCKIDADCQFLWRAPANVTCYQGICKCRIENGTLVHCASINANSTSSDAQIAAGLIGRVCSLDKDCAQDANAHCNTTRKQCSCKSGFVSSPDSLRCLPEVQYLKSGCEFAKQCLAKTPNTTCASGVCRCEETLYHFENSCWPKIGFGSVCNVDQECGHVKGAICNSLKLCGCPAKTVVAPDATACLPVATKIEDPCTESIQCTELLGNNGVCQEKHCRCREQHHHSAETKKCTINKKFNEACEMDHECANGENIGDATAMRCTPSISPGAKKVCACQGKTHYDNLIAKCVNDSSSGADRAVLGNLAAFATALACYAFRF